MPILDVLFVSTPAALVLLDLRKRRVGIGHLVVLGYVYPLIAILMVASPGYSPPSIAIDPSLGNVARGAVHLGNCWLFALLLLRRGTINKRNVPLLGIAVAAGVLMAASVVMSGPSGGLLDGLLRAVLVVVLAVNAIALIPTQACDRPGAFVGDLARGLYFLMLGVVLVGVYVRVIYGPFPTWTPRFGRPLNPRVLSQLLVLAAVLMTLHSDRLRYAFVAGVPILATGSRSSIAMLGLFLIGHTWVRRRSHALLLALAGVALAGTVVLTGEKLPVLARSEVFAGRLGLWSNALGRLPDVWAWGAGERYMLHQQASDPLLEVTRVHNGFLEAITSHGVWYTLAVFGVYALFAVRVVRKLPPPGPEEAPLFPWRELAGWTLLEALAESFVGTSIWTNLGDTFSFLVLTVLSVATLVVVRMRGGERAYGLEG